MVKVNIVKAKIETKHDERENDADNRQTTENLISEVLLWNQAGLHNECVMLPNEKS
jgi:hypothetical protein